MTTSQHSIFHRLAHDRPHGPALANSNTDNTVENHIGGAPQAAPPNPSTFYKTYLDTNVQLLADRDYFEPNDDGYTCYSGAAAGHNTSLDDAPVEGHAGAYRLAVRLANRSNGAPLATIIEQGSYSTLNSRGSLLSAGRFPSLRAPDNSSPNRRRSRSLDEKALHDIQEDMARETDSSAVAVPQTRLNSEHDAVDPASGTATPLTSYRFEAQPSSSSHSDDEMCDHDDRGVRGFIRGVLQNVRGVSRTRSRSSSMTHALIMKHRGSPLSASESSPQFNQHSHDTEAFRQSQHSRNTSTRSSEGATIPPALGDQTRNRATPVSGTERSARMYPSHAQSRSDATELSTVCGSMLPVLPNRDATRSHERPFSTPVVHAGTRDVAQDESTAQASTYHHDMFDISARYTFEGVPMFRGQLSSDKETGIARDVFSSQNASFCSTMSTSYSGTVLGVDVDLQHDFSHSIRRSQSPPTPVWFTPQMAELERQASSPPSPEPRKKISPNHVQCHSITSSALTSLLPLAAATGIVQPNYKTPTISFYSPSGNLIQPESSSPLGPESSDYSGSPTITTSYYNRQDAATALPIGGVPTRPLLMPMTTLPTPKAPLPLHLQHHHNYRRPEMSQISSRGSSVTSKRPVKGCDGFVRENSLTPRSGIFFPHGGDEAHRTARLTLHDLKAEARFYKARFLGMAASQSFAPSIPKGKTLQKRRIHNYDTYAMKPQTEPRTDRSRQDTLGSLTAHALRICFCQPYDGAGLSTHATAARPRKAGQPFPANGKMEVDQEAHDAERSLPIARVVGSGKRTDGGNARKASRTGSAFSSTSQRASRTGAAKIKAD
ncbi:hypothetical protein C7974DRAFT_375244 [Boeremia exigua]|uniref:uncharacterized protein n=1 Tax=Boeremia exigua TaxID=749465 RepID=UPI001E8D9B2F|nr:uncharacterized protein C7974DRAFT_375244 [Boeremia exigua]KAH6633112.1 hypothetical protein C7974DRAFT_375244 [Boeremia exigua]